jgi:hypothetical protein
MCATDLDLDPEIAETADIAEDEEAPGDRAPGVAWGRAEPHPAAK